MGYHRAGFEVVGVDIAPQPHYPFEFHQGDALIYLEHLITGWKCGPIGYTGPEFDVIHASPPCHDHSILKSRTGFDGTGWLLSATLDRLKATGLSWVVENVMGADMPDPIMLCGSMFGLGVRRHRLFSSSVKLPQSVCDHTAQGQPWGVYGHGGGSDNGRGHSATKAEAAAAMGIDWMNYREMAQAIPPAYTEHIGKFLMNEVQNAQRSVPQLREASV